MRARPTEPVSFPVFFHLWAVERGWKVPLLHYRMAVWLEALERDGVLMVFRGAAKSTMLAIYNAWRYYRDPTYRILHQGDQEGTAYKTSRDTKAVLQRHPLTRGASTRGEVAFWWLEGADDERNPSMQAAGILSNITSSRADEIQNDDVEVPRNIGTGEAREKLRYRLSEQTHILVPGGRRLWVGTPHTHDSIYQERIDAGAESLRIALFEHEARIDAAQGAVDIGFVPDIAFSGIGVGTRVLKAGIDYSLRGTTVRLQEGSADFYAGNVWPERFDHDEVVRRRRECRTFNEWDSQYQLHARPLTDVRLDPDRIMAYECEPQLRTVNNTLIMELDGVPMAGVSTYWDCALGRPSGDTSAFSVVFTDAGGRLYWHLAEALTGDIDAQCLQVRAFVERYSLPHVTVETNGVGGFVPPVLRRHLKGLICGVSEWVAAGDKNKRILNALEAPLSGRFLWAHTRVLDGPAPNQMRQWNPAVKGQADDYLDSAAGAIAQTPVRVDRIPIRAVGKLAQVPGNDWRPASGVHEAIVEL